MTYLSLRSVAEYTSLSSRTLRRWVNDPEDPLPAYRVGGKLLFKLEQLEHWLARHQVQPLDMAQLADDIIESLREQKHD